MVGDKYILEPEAILDHCVAAEGKRWYLVKWKPKWVKKNQLPEGVFEKWEEKKAKRAKILAENPDEKIEPEEEETGFRILEERRIQPGEEIDLDALNKELNGRADEEEEGEDGEEEEDGEEDEDEEGDEEDEEGMDEDEEEEEEEKYNINGVEVKEEPDDDGEYSGQNGLNISDDEELNTLSSIDRDIVLNALPGDAEVKEEDIKEEEEEEDTKISIPTDYSKPYS